MAVYTPRINERLFNLANTFYGVLDDEAYTSLVIENQDTWDGQSSLEPVELIFPDTVAEITYGIQDADTLALKQAIESPTFPNIATIGFTTNVSGRTGEEINETEAVKQDVLYRVLTYRGFREWRPQFGTRVFEAMTHIQSIELGLEAVRVTRNALAVARERYTVDAVNYRFIGDVLHLVVVVMPLFGAEEVQVVIPVTIDLS